MITAQEPAIQWEKNWGGSGEDRANSVQQTTDGGYIAAGFTFSNDGDVSGNQGNADFWVVKLDANGNLDWKKALGGTAEDRANSIEQTTDGGYIVAGYTRSNNGDVSGNHGLSDFWVVKLDGSGNLEWQKTLGGTADDRANSVQETTDGGYIVAGYTNSNNGDVSGNHGQADFWIVKLDGSGNFQWQKALGGSFIDEAYSVRQTADGGYIAAGHTVSINTGDVTGNHGINDFWVVRLDSGGALIWQKALGGTQQDIARSIQQTADGGYIVTGHTQSNDDDVSGNHGFDDFWVVKLDTSGGLEWQKTLGGSDIDQAHSVQQTTDSGFIVLGHSFSNNGDVSGNHGSWDFWVVRLDNTGTLQWQKNLGGSDSDVTASIQQTTDGGFVAAGCSFSNNGDVSDNNGDFDFWIVKLEPEPLGVSDIFKESVHIYPNPFTNIINISDIKGIKSITLSDVSGRTIKSIPAAPELNLSDLKPGIYFINLHKENGDVGSFKVMKK
ncbi:MAG: T9SS type A sorting domain-containing protein [Flavobacteriaceae bacterium]|nr:T9SS type A sorting domain-containing protein [Flavobacteriaceae bacterium]